LPGFSLRNQGGQRCFLSLYRERIQVPGSGGGVVAEGGQAAEPMFRPGWECENRQCSRRHEFVQS
jgi:hypothetical protein